MTVDRTSTITWKGAGMLGFEDATLKVWRAVAHKHSVGVNTLVVENSSFAKADREECGFVYKHLVLRRNILHHVSMEHVEKQEKLQRENPPPRARAGPGCGYVDDG